MFVGRGLESLSSSSLPSSAKIVIISDNEFKSLESLASFPDLEEVIADNNLIESDIKMPQLLNLHTLSLNKNKISDLDDLLDHLVDNTPNLALLSLLGNPVSPDPIYRHLYKLQEQAESTESRGDSVENDDNEDEYERYRLRILYRLPKLQFLDSTKVTDTERIEARRRGQFLQIKKADLKQKESEEDFFKLSNLGSLAPSRVSEWISALTPLKDLASEENLTPLGDPVKKKTPKAFFGKNQYIYKGRFSEGNRFIANLDL